MPETLQQSKYFDLYATGAATVPPSSSVTKLKTVPKARRSRKDGTSAVGDEFETTLPEKTALVPPDRSSSRPPHPSSYSASSPFRALTPTSICLEEDYTCTSDTSADHASGFSHGSRSNAATPGDEQDVFLDALEEISPVQRTLARSGSSTSTELSVSPLTTTSMLLRSSTNETLASNAGALDNSTACVPPTLAFSRHASVPSTSMITGIPSIKDIIANYQPASPVVTSYSFHGSPPVPAIPGKFQKQAEVIPSIDEIIRKNSSSLKPAAIALRAGSAPPNVQGRYRSRTITESSDVSQTRSSMDSVAGEIIESMRATTSHKSLHHARSQPSFSLPQTQHSAGHASASHDSKSSSSHSGTKSLTSRSHSHRSLTRSTQSVAQYLKSPRLTRLMVLQRPPNHHLTVSFADVGDADGHPVVIFLGLGCVRYLVALYDELAISLGLRLICIDRWGLGRTSAVPDSRRGFFEWASVVEEVLDHLSVSKFSFMAHSAGAPYALAASIRLQDRIHGSVHLLAPWVSTAAEAAAGAYKWLRYVPSSVIRSAQTAEWKLQAWKLGKPPTIPLVGLGFDPNAPICSENVSPVLAQYADLDRSKSFDAQSRNTTNKRTTQDPKPSDSEGPCAYTANRPTMSMSTPGRTHRKDILISSRNKTSKGFFGNLLRSPRSPGTSSATPGTPQNITTDAGHRPQSRSSMTTDTTVFPHDSSPHTSDIDMATALMRASYAESLSGGTADLLAILERTAKAPGFSYSDVECPVKVWHGLKDEKISLQSVLSLESTIRRCKVTVIPGADHSLMTNVAVLVQVLDSIAKESVL